jgi:hypothetical protein
MGKLEMLRSRYPDNESLKYEPLESCPRCHGTGEYLSGLGEWSACFCLYIDPEFANLFPDIHDWFNRQVEYFKNCDYYKEAKKKEAKKK